MTNAKRRWFWLGSATWAAGACTCAPEQPNDGVADGGLAPSATSSLAAPPAASSAGRPERPPVDALELARKVAPDLEGRLRPEGDEGWLNAWSMASPLPQRVVADVRDDPTGKLTAGGQPVVLEAACSSDGFVRPLERDDRAPNPHHAVLRLYAVSDEAREVSVLAGVAGRLEVWVGATRALEAGETDGRGEARPFADERRATAQLVEGKNLITAIFEATGAREPGFWLRLADLDGAPLPGVAYAESDEAARCSDAGLLSLAPEPRVVAGGFIIDVHPRFSGLGPRTPDALDRLTQQVDGGAKAPVGCLLPPRPHPLRVPPRCTTTLTPLEPGEHRVRWHLDAPVGPPLALAVRKDVHDRVAALGERARAAAKSPLPRASVESFQASVDRLSRSLTEGERYPDWLGRRVEEAEAIAVGFAKGVDPYPRRSGIVERAYRSKLDGSLQSYLAYIPPSYDPEGPPMPMVVVAHGLGHQPEHALRAVIGQARDETMSLEWAQKHLPPFPDLGVILVAPSGYGNAGPWPIGEHDVMRVVDEMKRAYRVDAARVSLTGYSLGGTVSFVVPLHYPGVFSAAAPLCGYPNLTTYESIRRVPKKPWEETMIARRYIAHYADNGLHLPLWIVHGGLDGPGRSKVVADAYRKLGYAHDFDVQEELDHNVWDYAYEHGRMIGWLKRHERPAAPSRVTWTSAEPRYDRAFWLRLLAAERSTDFAKIDAEVDESTGTLRITTDNVAHFAIDRQAMGELARAVAKIELDAQPLVFPNGEGEVFASKAEGAWSVASTAPDLAGRKRPGVAGPLDDVLRHSTLIVVGTQDDRQLSALRAVAMHHASYDTWSGARYPSRADFEMTPDQNSTHSLVLVGGPAQNLVTRSLAGELPVQLDPGGLTFRGARHEGPDVGVSLIVVHPRNPDEYVVLHAGVGSEGALASRHLPRFAPDFVVYDRRITAQRGGLLLDRREVLEAGFFDETWH